MRHSSTKTASKRHFAVSTRARFFFWLAIVALMTIFAIVAPFFAPHDPYEVNLANVTAAPSNDYPMGTDYLGRCIESRLMCGAARSIISAYIVVIITFCIGSAIGLICGYIGGKFDTIVMRFVDAAQAFPSLIFSIAVAAMLGGGMANCIIAMCAIGWTGYARLARSQAIRLKERPYVAAAKISGMGRVSILVKTIMPNALTPLVVYASMHIGSSILGFAGLSFLGLGTTPPFPEWGNMLNDGRDTLQLAPWTVFFPGAAIVVVVMVLGMFGDSVNAMLNPREREHAK